jgi:hypothetical protein
MRHRGTGERRAFKGPREVVRESTEESLFSGLLSKPLSQLLIHRLAVPHGYEPNDSFLLINAIDDVKPANAIFP